jgi:hypothetical protein
MASLALAGCGSRTDLTPQAGHQLPVAPYGRADRPTTAELLARPPQLAPERTVELRRKSEERADDPFDLPPDVGDRPSDELSSPTSTDPAPSAPDLPPASNTPKS